MDVYLFDFIMFIKSTILLQELAAFFIEDSKPSETSGNPAISERLAFLKL